MREHGERQIDRWMKWAAVIGPIISGIIFGGAGYVAGFQAAKQQILANTTRIGLIEGWKDKQEEFNQKTVISITRLKTLVKDMTP